MGEASDFNELAKKKLYLLRFTIVTASYRMTTKKFILSQTTSYKSTPTTL